MASASIDVRSSASTTKKAVCFAIAAKLLSALFVSLGLLAAPLQICLYVSLTFLLFAIFAPSKADAK